MVAKDIDDDNKVSVYGNIIASLSTTSLLLFTHPLHYHIS